MTLFYLKQYGNVFEARLAADTFLNAWQGRIILPSGFEARSVIYGDGIGEIWQTPPGFREESITFAGGRTTGWSGDGLLFRFAIVPAGEVRTELIRFDSLTSAYAADGHGTKAPAVLQPITVNRRDILSATTSLRFPERETAPAPFTLLAVRDANIFNGRQAVLFGPADSGSGIDHYEAEEHTSEGIIGWHEAQSPYLVNPGTLRISVRAVDRNGNFRVESIALQEGWPFGIVLAAVGILVMLYVLGRHFFKKRRKINISL